METDNIQERIDAIALAMLSKALPQPRAEFMFHANRRPTVCLAWDSNKPVSGYKFFHGPIETVLAEAEEYVASLPSPEEARMTVFMSALAEAVELGKKNDIDVEFVNPLVALMKRLSKNALQHTPVTP